MKQVKFDESGKKIVDLPEDHCSCGEGTTTTEEPTTTTEGPITTTPPSKMKKLRFILFYPITDIHIAQDGWIVRIILQ